MDYTFTPMTGFTKLFGSLVTSTIWREDDKTRIVWITLLALTDRHGNVGASIPGLAALANMSIQDCETALGKLMAPDTYSRTKEHEGRRIEEIDGGFHILNYVKYRELGKQIDRSLYLREKQREHRSKSTMSTEVNKPSTSPSASVSASASASVSESLGKGGVGEGELPLPGETRKRFTPPTSAELDVLGEKIGLSSIEVRKFEAFYESNGWRVGKNPMKSVSASMAGWKLRNDGNHQPPQHPEMRTQPPANPITIKRLN